MNEMKLQMPEIVDPYKDYEEMTLSEYEQFLGVDEEETKEENVVESTEDLSLEVPESVEEQEETKENVGDNSSTNPEEVDESAQAWFDILSENGQIVETEDLKFDGSWDSLTQLQERYNEIIQENIYQGILNNVPEANRRLVEAALQGVEDDKLAMILSNKQDQSTTYTTLEEKKSALVKYRKSLGETDEDINRYVEYLEDTDNLEKVADRAIQAMLDNASKLAEQEIENKKRERQEAARQWNEYKEGVDKYLKDNKVTPKKANLIRESLTKTDSTGNVGVVSAINQILTGDSMELKVQLAEFLTFFDGKKIDVDKYKGTSSAQARTLKDRLNSQRTPGKGSIGSSKNSGDMVEITERYSLFPSA